MGQLASSRADILPREVVEELSLLQDRVPGFGYPAAARIIEEELGAPVAELFAWFDTVPLAAASLSQVHRARLWGGEEVVVKVQRPRLAALFELDLQALRGVAQYLQRSKKYGGSTRDWIGTFVEDKAVLVGLRAACVCRPGAYLACVRRTYLLPWGFVRQLAFRRLTSLLTRVCPCTRWPGISFL